MSDSVDRVFVHALNTVKKIPRAGSSRRPPPADRLKLYGLYKQSMEGDVEDVMARPFGEGADVQGEKEKWDAWYEQRSLTRTEAKRRYITTLIETMHRYASTTPEAQELISELEYVWDQIKSNTTSSSSSSPLQSPGMPPHLPHHQQNYESIEERMSRPVDTNTRRHAGGDSRLRVLSPVSQPEDDYSRRRNSISSSEEREHEEDEDDGEEEEDEEDEDFQEARNSPFEDEEHDGDEDALPRRSGGRDGNTDIRNRRWRRRVEQALTKMNAEVAAMREQMETRADLSRRRSRLWAWIKWLVWVAIRQIFWDLAIVTIALIWLRLRGDKRFEERLKTLLLRFKAKLVTIRYWRYLPRFLSFP